MCTIFVAQIMKLVHCIWLNHNSPHQDKLAILVAVRMTELIERENTSSMLRILDIISIVVY
jgi:hypothetical protein